MEKRESSYNVSGNVNWYSHSGEEYGGSLKNKKIELLYDPAILGHISEENLNSKRHLHLIVHCNTMHNSQDIEAT